MKALKYKYWEVTEDGRVFVKQGAPKSSFNRAVKKLDQLINECDKFNSLLSTPSHEKPGYNELDKLPF